MIVAAFLLASWLGCVIAASPWSDKMGRRFWILLGAAIQVVGTVICVSSYSSGQLIGGRVIIVSLCYLPATLRCWGSSRSQGVGNGLVVATGPVYVAEITPVTKMRGPLVGVLMGFACTATALAYWV